MAIDVEDFNYISSSDTDGVLFFVEGTLNYTATPNAPYYAYEYKSASHDTGIDAVLKPHMLVSFDQNVWYQVDMKPFRYTNSTIASGYQDMFNGGAASNVGNIGVGVSVYDQFGGPLYYRLWGTPL